MAIAIKEHYRQIRGDEQSLRVGFVVTGADSEHEALNQTRAVAPQYYPDNAAWNTNPPVFNSSTNLSWVLVNVTIEEFDAPDINRNTGVNQYYTAGQYAFRSTCPIYDFDIGTQSVKTTEAISSVPYKESGLGELPNGNAIEVQTVGNNLDVRGTTKQVPRSRFALAWNPPNVFAISPTWVRNAMSMVGKVNSQRFLEDVLDAGFKEESLLFTGFTGKQIDQRNNYWELRFQFEYAQENVAELTFDGISGTITVPATQVKGHDYVWIEREPAIKNTTGTGGGDPVKIPGIRQVTVQKIYDTADFNDLFRVNATDGVLYVQGCPGFLNVTADTTPP